MYDIRQHGTATKLLRAAVPKLVLPHSPRCRRTRPTSGC